MYRCLFSLTLFVSAVLLFLIEPMVAKVLLPLYGGTASVWTSCMLFFQGMLFFAYSYSWYVARKGRVTHWRKYYIFLCLISFMVMPVVFVPKLGSALPEWDILLQLLGGIGLPILVIGAAAPLLQRAYSCTAATGAADPYFLYAVSNCGSMIALLAYPCVIEYFLTLDQQFTLWNTLYFIYLILVLVLLYGLYFIEDKPLDIPVSPTQSIGFILPLRWVFLSFIACALMLGVTSYITTDVAVTPLFWVLPLALYLLSFMLTFARHPLISHAFVERRLLYFLFFPLLGFIIGVHETPVLFLVFSHLLGFFSLALLCQGTLVRLRPSVEHLTFFYLCMALGGFFAGIFNGMIAPKIFSAAYEYPLMIFLALFCLPKGDMKQEKKPLFIIITLLFVAYFLPHIVSSVYWIQKYHVLEITALFMLCFWFNKRSHMISSVALLFMFLWLPYFKNMHILVQNRNFYGIKQVFVEQGVHVLLSQSTIHGFQVPGISDTERAGLAYYGLVWPVMQMLQARGQPLEAMVIGLGTGLMACQFRAEDHLNMVEIDEQVITIAKNPKLFTYLRDCPPQLRLIKEDGLRAIQKAKAHSYDVLVIDAFSSDAIPVHLLTQEAFALYKEKIKKDGIILVHLSNRHLRLLPIVAAAGRVLDLVVLHQSQAAKPSLGQFPADWALLTENEQVALQTMGLGWHFMTEVSIKPWTNQYSNVLSVLKI